MVLFPKELWKEKQYSKQLKVRAGICAHFHVLFCNQLPLTLRQPAMHLRWWALHQILSKCPLVFPSPGLTPCLGFLLSLTLLFFALFFRISLFSGFSSWTQPLFEQMIFRVCTLPMSYQAKSIMSSLLLILLLSWPSLINITKDDLLHVAARRNSLHHSMTGDWGGLKHAFCHSFANKSCRPRHDFHFPLYVTHHGTSSIKYFETFKNAERSRKVHTVV